LSTPEAKKKEKLFMTEKYTRLISTKITPEMFDKLKDLAESEDRPISNMVRRLITEALFHRKAGTTKV